MRIQSQSSVTHLSRDVGHNVGALYSVLDKVLSILRGPLGLCDVYIIFFMLR